MSRTLRFLTPVVFFVGLGLVMMVAAPVRPAFGRTRTSPCHRAAAKDPEKKCVASKRKAVRRDLRRAAVQRPAVASAVRAPAGRPSSPASARSGGAVRAGVEKRANRGLNKRRLATRPQRRLAARMAMVAPATHAAPATGPGWVNIESKPGIVRVYINGRTVGQTPLQVQLTEGRHTIEAIREDGVRQRRVIDIEPGQQRYLVLVS